MEKKDKIVITPEKSIKKSFNASVSAFMWRKKKYQFSQQEIPPQNTTFYLPVNCCISNILTRELLRRFYQVTKPL